MAGWPQAFVAAIGRWRLERQANREAMSIARGIYPALWESVRRKIGSTSELDLTDYAQVRAAQLAHERIDALMRANPTVPVAYATQLLVKATDRAMDLVLAAATDARRSAA